MSRCQQVIRILTVVERLLDGWYTLDELAAVTGVTPRTIRRDLVVIEVLYAALTDDRESGRRRYHLIRRPMFSTIERRSA